jgi:hypothetical protein
MARAALRTVGKAIVDRIRGQRPGALRAFVVAVLVGIAVAVLTYRALRSGD